MGYFIVITLYAVYVIIGPKHPLSGPSGPCAEEQNKKVKKLISAEKVKILDRLESGAHVTALAKDHNVNESIIRYIRQCNDKIRASVSSAGNVAS